jgi:hypothetical protein
LTISEFALAARRLRIASGAALSFDIPANLIWEEVLPCRLAAESAAPRKATCGPDQGIASPYKVADRRNPPPECPLAQLGGKA